MTAYDSHPLTRRALLAASVALPLAGLTGPALAQSRLSPTRRAAAAHQAEAPNTWSMATAINDHGQVAGWSGFTFGSDSRAVLWEDGQIIDLGALPGGESSEAWDINDHGQVVGWSATADASSIATLWQEGEIIDLGGLPDARGYVSSSARAINSIGQIVGTSASRAVLWEDEEIVELGTLPGGESSEAWDINNAGQIVGQSNITDGEYHAALWQDGHVTDLGRLPGATGPDDRSLAVAINDGGTIVGESDTASIDNHGHAVVWRDGAITELNGNRGHVWSRANAVNDTGQIVGVFANMLATPGDLGSTDHAALWDGGKIIDLGALPGVKGSRALSINNAGQIVGWSLAPGIYGYRAVLWEDGQIFDLGTLPDAPHE